jgi:beta-mannosidase
LLDIQTCYLVIMFRFLFLSLILIADIVSAQCIEQPLAAQWRMRVFSDRAVVKGAWNKASVPGCVHSDLIRSEKIEHPFYGTNEADCEWVAETTWQYETFPFDVPDSIFNKAVVQWKFHGLDTYARVELNGVKILDTDNAHRSWIVDVKPHLNTVDNVLRITFFPAQVRANELLAALPYPIPGDSIRAVVRKPQFHFGWDWGPRLVTSGITRPIEWIAYDTIRLDEGYFNTYSVTEQLAKMKYEAKVYSQTDATVLVKLTCNTNSSETDSTYSLKAGVNVIELPFEIQHPQLWWSNGQGHSSLYSFEVKMLVEGTEQAHQSELVGVREIRLITQPDSIGESFYFQLNGLPVFAKGANYIPIRYFPGDATYDDYFKLIMQCKDANINMLRVWGGGVYEDEMFYDLCDQYGIMVWHDFMFACSMYPGDESFLKNVKAEAEEQVRRLRNHPCIALWCGNNENAEGWERWGWKSGLTPSEIQQVQAAYDAVFKNVLPKAVSQNSTTSYWESSPRLGRGDPLSITEGDSHYWGVWHDEEPFEVLQTKVPRFMSEFGMQSYPSNEVVQEMLEGDEFETGDKGIAMHQKHSRGFALMEKYMNNWYEPVSPDDDSLYGEMTQVVQAEGIALGIEAQRRAMPRCMGTLFWQLNDVWPSFSWSCIDYKGTPKLLYEMLKTVYAPQLISCTLDGDELQIWFVSDARIDRDNMVLDYAIYNGATFKGEANQKLRSLDKSIYQSPKLDCTIGYGSSKIHTILLEDLGIDSPENMIIEARISYPNQPNPEYKRIQKIIPKSDMAIIPYRSVQQIYDPKTRSKKEQSSVLFKRRFMD